MNIDDKDLEEFFRKQTWIQRFHAWIERIAKPISRWMERYKLHSHVVPYSIVAGLVALVVFALLFASPLNFPEGSLVKVPKGSTIEDVAQMLAEKDIVHSAFLFKVFASLHGKVVAGEYAFTEKEHVLKIASRLATGDYEMRPVRISVWDGATSAEITSLLKQRLPDFDSETFFELAVAHEGKLFPDTYFVYPGDEPQIVLDAMLKNFNEKIRAADVALALARFGRPLEEVLTMASLLEREAADMQNRRMIAGLLWDRIENDMALQVDAAFLYITNRNTYELTKTDLTQDSPYNTYINKGLPPGPIGNPSIDAIMAAATPIKTDYVFYLSDRKGLLYYSKTYEEHLRLKALYVD